MKYLFISNVDIRNRRGGWDGLGGKIYDLLTAEYSDVGLLEKLNPPLPFKDKLLSKALRVAKLPASFPAFSSSRLKAYARLVEEQMDPTADHLVFHGPTQWVDYKPNKPYSVYLDCCFITYMEVYHRIDQYSRKQIGRIADKERLFLKNAHSVLFTSNWALRETCRHYDLPGDNFVNIGEGPLFHSENVPPSKPVKNQFFFIATDFAGKGGAEICRSFRKFGEQFPDYQLILAGQQPPEEFLTQKNVRYVGFINKSIPEGDAQLKELYMQSRALLLLTRRDIAPVVVIEAGCFGCPTIATGIASLPEMIKDKVTGFLIEPNEDGVLNAMLDIARMDERQLVKMQADTRAFINESFSWDEVGRRLTGAIGTPVLSTMSRSN